MAYDYFAPLTNAMNAYAQSDTQGAQNAMAMRQFEDEQRLHQMKYNQANIAYQQALDEHNYKNGLKEYLAKNQTQAVSNPDYANYQQMKSGAYGPPIPQEDINRFAQDAPQTVSGWKQSNERLAAANAYVSGTPEPAKTIEQPVHILKGSLDYAKLMGRPDKMAEIQKQILDEVSKVGALTGDGQATVDAYNQMTGDNVKYLGQKGEWTVASTKDGKIYAFNSKMAAATGDPAKAFVQLAEGPEKQGKIIDKTVPLGDKMLIQYSDGTQEERPIAAKPDTVVKIENANAKAAQGPKPKPLPASQVSDLADFKAMVTNLNNAAEIAKRVNTGPIAGRGQSIASKFGGSSKDFIDFRQKLSTVNNIMLKLRSGAAVTDQEYQRFLQEMPSVNDTEDVRDAKLQNAIAYMTNLQNDKMQAYAEAGYIVPQSTSIQSQPKAKSTTGKGAKPSLGAIFGGK